METMAWVTFIFQFAERRVQRCNLYLFKSQLSISRWDDDLEREVDEERDTDFQTWWAIRTHFFYLSESSLSSSSERKVEVDDSRKEIIISGGKLTNVKGNYHEHMSWRVSGWIPSKVIITVSYKFHIFRVMIVIVLYKDRFTWTLIEHIQFFPRGG